MANLKEIRGRISSVKTTRQVTSAMKMVAAAKLRKAQEKFLNLRPYAEKLNELLVLLAGSLKNEEDFAYADQREVKTLTVVVVTSDKGLCGAFNSNVIKESINVAKQQYSHLSTENIEFYCIGKYGYKALKKRGYNVNDKYLQLLDTTAFDPIKEAAAFFMEQFVSNKTDKLLIVYNHFINAAVQRVQNEIFLPVVLEDKEESEEQTDYIFEPDKKEITEVLIPQSLKIQFYKALLDSNASEQGARMTAMHQATDNATDLIKQLTLSYNKARQAAITNQILEVVNGAEALRNG